MNEYSKEIIDKIFPYLQDEESRFIFNKRVEYSINDSIESIQNIVFSLPLGEKVKNIINEKKDCELFIFGAGIVGRLFYSIFSEFNWKGFVDNNKKNIDLQTLKIPIYSFEEVKEKFNNPVFIIASTRYYNEIMEQLLNEKIDIKSIINVGKMQKEYVKLQYFEFNEINKRSKVVFVDGGCYDGQTSREFITRCNNTYEHIYAFEPDKANYLHCQNSLEQYDNITLVNKGLYDRNEVLSFNATADIGSKIDNKGTSSIETCCLDNFLDGDKPVFIKLDIEGAELKALQGAKKLLEKNNVSLAVSVYHKKEDIWEIPYYLMKINPNYKFYLRHYTLFDSDTILYAINKNGETQNNEQ